MAAGNMTDRIDHGHHRQAKGQRNAEEADPQIGKARRDHRAAAAAENQPEGADELGQSLLHITHRTLSYAGDHGRPRQGQSISVAARRNRVMVHSPKTHYKRAEMAHAAVSKGFIMGFRLLLLPLACLALSGCVSAVTTVVTAPVKAVGQVADWSTTSQEESDRNRGRAMRQREARSEEHTSELQS